MAKMETAEVKAMRDEMLADLRAKRANLADAQTGLSNVLLGQGYIVVSEGNIGLTFDVTNMVATNPRPAGGILRAMRFTRRDAETLAPNVKNGADVPAKAIHVKDAIRIEIAQIESVINMLESAAI